MSNASTEKNNLLSDPIGRSLQRLTVPTVLGMLSVLMFGLVDMFFISLMGTQALAAISFTFPVSFAIHCVTMGLGIGLSTSVGRLLGKGKHTNAAQFSSHAILLTFLLITLVSAFGLWQLTPLFSTLGAQAELMPLIADYMHSWFLFVPFLAISMSGSSVMRAAGDTKSPAIILVISGAINGCLDPLLIFGIGPFPELGMQGAAVASGISWIIAVISTIYILKKQDHMLGKIRAVHLMQDWNLLLRISSPIILSMALTPLYGAILMRLLSDFGSASVAAYGVAQRVESILTIVVTSLASALTPFMAQNLGAKQRERAFKALFYAIYFAMAFQFLVFISMIPLSTVIAHLFSDDSRVSDLLWLYLLIVPFSYGFQAIVMLVINSLNAQYRTLDAFYWNLCRLFVLLLPCSWIGSRLYATEGLFIGISVANILVGSAAYLYAKKQRNRLAYYA